MEYSWNQPVCERDWIERNSTKNLGTGDTYIYRMPIRLRNPIPEQCCYCGQLTIFGVYMRVDPSAVPHPSVKKIDE